MWTIVDRPKGRTNILVCSTMEEAVEARKTSTIPVLDPVEVQQLKGLSEEEAESMLMVKEVFGDIYPERPTLEKKDKPGSLAQRRKELLAKKRVDSS